MSPVKIGFLRLQNLFSSVHPQTVARVNAMVSMSAYYSKGIVAILVVVYSMDNTSLNSFF
jgi:hypothetical protein